MNSYLLYSDKNISGELTYPSFHDMYKDLNLNIVLKTMAQGDAFMIEKIRSVMMVPTVCAAEINYRYDIVNDFYENEELIGELFRLGQEGYKQAEQFKKEMEQNRSKSTVRTSSIVTSLNFLEASFSLLQQIKSCIQPEKLELRSRGLQQFRERFMRYPLEEFAAFHNKILFYTMGGEGIFSVQLSGGLKLEKSRMDDCRNYRMQSSKGSYLKLKKLYYKILKKDTIYIENESLDKDVKIFIEANMQRIIEEYQPLIENCQTFWFEFSKEIAFYKGINQFQHRAEDLFLPLCYGTVSEYRNQKNIEGLYDLSLGLYTQTHPVPNSLKNENKRLTIITGANQGGKSTFLRSFGIAQILFQCGIPVPAQQFCSGLYSRIHTHFTRKEDAMLTRGRLEEELKRMSQIISEVTQDSLILLNESFASTTEKEGSQIAANIIKPLYHKGIEVIMVTHLHEFARTLYEENLDGTEFLVAERKEDGVRTFHILRGKPHYSSYGTDLYQYMIGEL